MRPEDPPSGDYSYDLTHDLDLDSGAVRETRPSPRPIQVPTETSDTDEDYSYDLAHDVPRD